jgi:AAA domain
MSELITPIVRENISIMIKGNSGLGKSYCFRNFPPEETLFINLEKLLPFENNFKLHKNYITKEQILSRLTSVAKDTLHSSLVTTIKATLAAKPTLKYVIIDSFTAFQDIIAYKINEMKTFKGFDVYAAIASETGAFLQGIKTIPAMVIVTGHEEMITDETDDNFKVKRVLVTGKKWEGKVESMFSIVLTAKTKTLDATKRPEYYLTMIPNRDGAKCPPFIFGEDVLDIPNDFYPSAKIIEGKYW